MKKVTYGLLGVSAAVIVVAAVSWTYIKETDKLNNVAPASGASTTTTTTQPVTTAPTVAPKPPTTPQAPAASVTAPQAPAATSAPVQPAAPTSAAPAVIPQASNVTPAPVTPGEVPEDVKSAMSGGSFQKKLSFPLTEEKMQAFVAASLKVQHINSKYDVQIASAQSDQMAIEYNNFAVEEISAAMKSMQNLTLEEYNELTQLTINDKEFNTIYQVYKQLAQEKRMTGKEISPAVSDVTPAVASPANATSSTGVPANSDTAPTPQGSLTLPGSQPVSR